MSSKHRQVVLQLQWLKLSITGAKPQATQHMSLDVHFYCR